MVQTEAHAVFLNAIAGRVVLRMQRLNPAHKVVQEMSFEACLEDAEKFRAGLDQAIESARRMQAGRRF